MLSPSRLHLALCLVTGVTCVTGYTTAGSCAPECRGVSDGSYVANPKDCHSYYECASEEPIDPPIDCNSGEYFDLGTGVCVGGDCPPNKCIPDCKFYPGSGAGNLTHRTDCTKYYEYDGINIPIEVECEPGHYFNGVDCTSTDINNCCDPCLVFCEFENTVVADPLDCTRYYYCVYSLSFPDMSTPCSPTGDYFDIILGTCVPDSDCDQLCSTTTTNTPATPDTPTPPSPDTTTTTTPDTITTTPQYCYDSWTCVEEGFFPACPNYCSPNYFSCDPWDIGGPAGLENCLEGQFINPDTDPLTCVPEAECPYPPYP